MDLDSTALKQSRNVSAFATEVVIVAGNRLLEHFGQVEGVPKGHADLLTKADIAVEQLILEELHRRFPGDQVIAEESTGLGTDSIEERCWVIDPLDGTVNFAMGIPFFSISLALLQDGEPVLGWVYDPVREELFQAHLGTGSFVNGRSLAASAGSTLPIPVGGSSGFVDRGSAGGPSSPVVSMISRFRKMRILGSQALQLCYVAAGRLLANISWESRLWDDAAGALIAREAGCCYSDFWGRDVFPLQAGAQALQGEPIHSIAACPSVHREMLAMLAGFPMGDDGEPGGIGE